MNMKKTILSVTLAVGTTLIGNSATLIPGCLAGSPNTAFDVLIKGGTLYDGTLAKPRVADIGIKGDRIAAIGDLKDGAVKTIDAKAYMVTPGFIDVHTHCDLTFKNAGKKLHFAYEIPSWRGNYNYLYQGVTTVVTGNCGKGYTDIGYWFDILDSVKFGTNVYHLAPHGQIRQELFGEDQPRELSADQLHALKKRVAEEMEKGAIGFSTGLEYAPGCLATTEELIEIAKVVKNHGGVYVTHARDLTGTIYEDGKIGVLEVLKEAIEIGRQADIPVHISHIQVNAPQNNVRASELLELIEKARNEGLDVTADQYPYDAGSSDITYIIPTR